MDRRPETAQRVLEAAASGMTLSEISEETGLSREAVRARLARHNIRAKDSRDRDHRDFVQDMTPLEAVEYLLGIIDELRGVAEDQTHPVDRIFSEHLSRRMRLFAMALYNVSPSLISKQQIFDFVYADVVAADEYPEIKIIDVFLYKLRQKLPPNVRIETKWGYGYRMIIDEAAE